MKEDLIGLIQLRLQKKGVLAKYAKSVKSASLGATTD